MPMPTVHQGQTIRTDIYVAWSVRWPYRSERFVYFGTKTGAIAKAKGLQGSWPYKPTIREVRW